MDNLTYTKFSFPCPRCDRVERLVEGSDRCEHCHFGYVLAMREQKRVEYERPLALFEFGEAA